MSNLQGEIMPNRTMTDLFDQLGLPSDEFSIRSFIMSNEGACSHSKLVHMSIWNDSQCMFLKESVAQDADWAIPVDALSAALSHIGISHRNPPQT
jgi:Protein of unknown function (DUF2789)